ncbi:MAG: bifunctional NADH-specific enoyl-ACP reductase/trans-2-enoyl-CoA reductase, partial [Clostridiales bacterium]|nr:bifunctional NADH-specific enoyl-ACP reductase/trans-2-enoyl-CoA reductase [Clostridiales bacterium]
VQKAVEKAWKAVGTDTLNKYADLDGFFDDFYKLFGFNVEGVDYSADVEQDVQIQEA